MRLMFNRTSTPGFAKNQKIDISAQPCPTVMAGGIAGGNCSQYYLTSEQGESPVSLKPPYKPPSMDEIRSLPWNGLKAMSTFAGCGGSSTGYRMAGFKMLWANEFIPAAADSYEANKADYTIVDRTDIRQINWREVMREVEIGPGELDVFDGSPPCASFSTAGKRHKGWGEVKVYSDTKQRTDDLFWEYIRAIKELQPRAFVAENVSGLVKGVAKGYFIEIMQDLKALGYNVRAKLLDAQWLGVPQQRQRIIFIGFRNDLGLDPIDAFPKPWTFRYSVADACPWILKAVHDTGGSFSTGEITDRPSPTITVGNAGSNSCHFKVEDGAISDNIKSELDKLAPGESSKKYFNLVRSSAEHPAPTVTATGGSHPGTATLMHPTESRKFTIEELKRICGFPDDFILTGTYAQQWERMGRSVPPLMMKAVAEGVRDVLLRKDGKC